MLFVTSGPEIGRPRRRSKALGFTLVELLAVVAMIGILSVIAMVGYRKYMNAAGASEAMSMIQGIRAAEEAYKAETLSYLNVSNSLSDYYPMAEGQWPTSQKWAWDQPTHGRYSLWRQLNISSDGPVRFGYAVIAGAPGDAMPVPTMFASQPTWPATTDPWYVIQATGDRDEDRVLALFLASSLSSEIYFENDTE